MPQSEKREAIIEATLELVAEHGFHNTPISKIAEKARVGIGSIYRYFKDKDELIHQVFLSIIEKESQTILKGYQTDASIQEQFMYLCTGIMQYSVQHPQEAGFLEQYLHSPYGLSHRREMMFGGEESKVKESPIHGLFEKAREQQLIKELPNYVLGALTFGPIFALLRDIHGGLISYDAELIAKAVEACWDAIKR